MTKEEDEVADVGNSGARSSKLGNLCVDEFRILSKGPGTKSPTTSSNSSSLASDAEKVRDGHWSSSFPSSSEPDAFDELSEITLSRSHESPEFSIARRSEKSVFEVRELSSGL